MARIHELPKVVYLAQFCTSHALVAMAVTAGRRGIDPVRIWAWNVQTAIALSKMSRFLPL